MDMNKIARFMRNTGPARFLVPVGIILIVFGIIMSGINTDSYLSTTGKITSVTEADMGYVDPEEHRPQEYDIGIRYTVDGKEYDAVFNNLTGTFREGEDIEVYYDPSDPEKISNGKMNKIIPFVMIGAGALAIIFGIFLAVKAFKKSKKLDEQGPFPTEQFDGIKTAPGVVEYYFRFDGNSLKPGYIVEDADRKILYEGKMIKQALVGARPFEFVNHVTGITEEHEVGHTTTQSYDNSMFSTRSGFKFDGKNVWDVLHDKGIRLSTNIASRFPNLVFDAAKDGKAFARIETCGMYVHEDEEKEHKINIPVGHMYYRFWTASSDFDTLFLTIFAISESEQTMVE